ncbi:MAG: VWA domain-containing protein, partial [Actinomycetota bacterium]|nr:VWA domain-containing protein [Actinomycetota bacterium]
FNPRVNTDNPDPRVPCVLLLDTSYSMSGKPIAELNKGLVAFGQDILEDPLARKRTEVMVISFGGGVHSDPNFVEAQDFNPPTLNAMGHTPMAEALLKALDALEQQKDVYRQAGIEYFRPWLVVMTDGTPTDDKHTVASALSALGEAQKRKAVTVFPIGIGDDVDMEFLGALSHDRDAVRLRDLEAFSDFFKWLSASMSSVSTSATYGSDDADVANKTQELGQIALPDAKGWATA